jgi:hypothetical protein
LFRRLPQELHLTLFPQGNPASEWLARTTEKIYMPDQSQDFSSFGRFSKNFGPENSGKNSEGNKHMKTTTNTIYAVLPLLAFAWFAVSPATRAVCQEGCFVR